MDYKQFWKLIDEARESAGGWEQMFNPLVKTLSKFSDEEIMRWGQIFWLYQKLSYKDRLWAAAYVINGGCSDDGFDYFRGWLTAQGKDVFLNALREPDSLADLGLECDEAWFEGMLSVSVDAYFKKHNLKDDYDHYYTEYDKYPLSSEEIDTIKSEIVYANEIEYFDFDANNELLKKMLPRLCKHFDW